MALTKLTNNTPIVWTADDFGKTLSIVRQEIQAKIMELVKRLGGSIYPRYYHDECGIDRYTFFTIDEDGYGEELFLEQVTITHDGDDVNVHLVNSEDCADYLWNLTDFNASNASNSYYFLKELEAIAEWVSEHGNEIAADWGDVEED